MQGDFDLNVFVIDIPRDDLCNPTGHECAIQAIIAAKQSTQANVAVLALMPENLNEAVSARFLSAGVVPLHDMQTGLSAIDAAIRAGRLARQKSAEQAVLLRSENYPMTRSRTAPGGEATNRDTQVLSEYQAKLALSESGLALPRSVFLSDKRQAGKSAASLRYPLALKGQGIAHKTEHGAVILGIDTDEALQAAIETLPDCPDGYLLEEMVEDVVAELLVGVSFDQSGLCLLTIGAGGILAELLTDTSSVLLPASRDALLSALQSLKVSKLLHGYRGKPAADIDHLVDAIYAVGNYAIQNHETLEELDINPLMVGTEQSIAADALITLRI